MSQNNNDPKGARVEVDLAEELTRGNYANLVIISHSPTEFILDFAAMLPGMKKAKVSDRVILAPEHAKRLLRSLNDNIARYEGTFGTINSAEAAQLSQQEPLSYIDMAHKLGEA